MKLQLRDAVQGRIAVKEQLLPHIGAHLLAQRRLTVTVEEAEDERSLKQNAFYWAFVLKTISDQARIGGVRYAADAWHELMKRQLLPRKVRKVKVAGRKRPTVSVSLGSTTDLSVKRMSAYLDRVMAMAATDLGVTFEAGKRWQEWSA